MSTQSLKCYVQVTSRERPGFVEFNFSINDPGLFLEMILPEKAFEDFCSHNKVTFLTDEQIREVEQQQQKWNGGNTMDVSPVQDK